MSEARDSTTFDVTLSLRAPCSSADTGLPWFSLTTLSLSEFGVSAPEFYGVAGVVNPVTSRGTGLSVGDLFFLRFFVRFDITFSPGARYLIFVII